jgi:hypothetical protein
VNRTGGPPGRKTGHAHTALAGAAGIGIVGAISWASSSGQTGLAIVLAIIGAFGAAARAIVPQNSRDRVEWTRVILDYQLHRCAVCDLACVRSMVGQVLPPAQRGLPVLDVVEGRSVSSSPSGWSSGQGRFTTVLRDGW